MFLRLITALVAVGLGVSSAMAASLDLCQDLSAWQFTSEGKYFGDGADMRQLLRVEHPWEHSEAGSYGAFSRQVSVPAGWSGPLYLRFYCSDNYFGMGLTEDARFTPNAAVSKFVGHRLKQVLVNDEVVWQRDIADDDGVTIFAVDISDYVRPGDAFTLTLRNFEQVASTQVLADDIHTQGKYGYDETPEDAGWEYNFSTICCFGDVELFSGAKPPVAAKSSLWDFEVRPPDLASRRPPELARIPLTMEYAERLPAEPFPVSCGVPFHRGELQSTRELALLDSNGREVPLQAKALGTWEDGSIKWALLDFLASSLNTAADQPYHLVYGEQSKPMHYRTHMMIEQRGEQWVVLNGALKVEFGEPGQEDLIRAIYLRDAEEPIATQIRCAYTVKGELDRDTATAVVDEVRLEEAGRVRCRLIVVGRMIGQQGTDYGRFQMRVELWDNSGFVRLWPRIFIDTPERKRIDISRYELTARTALGREALATTAYTEPTPVGRQISVDQDAWHHFEVEGPRHETLAEGQHADGWVDVCGEPGGIATYVQDFSELFPKELRVRDRRLRIRLFAPGSRTPLYQPMQGEAKRHQVMLFFHEEPVQQGELRQIWRCIQRRPRLFDQDWFRDTLAFRHVGLDTLEAEVVPGMYKAIGGAQWVKVDDAEDSKCAYGIRHYPDGGPVPRDEDFDKACPLNYYYDALHVIGMEYIATANRGLFDELERGVYHVMDIDTCHYSPQAPWRVGGQYGPGSYKEANHNEVEGALTPKGTYLNGIVDYYFLSGDPDVLEAAQLIAAFDMNPDMQSRWWPPGWRGALRCISFPMWNITRMYAEFHADEYERAFRWYLGRIMENAELRRGSLEGPCAQPGYLGATPGHASITMRALMEYYYTTGDPLMGRLVAAVGMNVYEECTREQDALLLQFVLKRPQNFMAAYVGMTFDVFPYTAWLLDNQEIMDFAHEYAKVGVQRNQMSNIYWNFAVDEGLWYMQNWGAQP